MSGWGLASEQLDVERGHYWENGWMLALGRYLMPVFLTEDRMGGVSAARRVSAHERRHCN